MKIYGTAFVHGPQAVGGPHRAAGTQAAGQTSSLSEVDQLDISAAGNMASRSLEGGIRHERVAELRAAIAAGTYDSDEKMSVALDRLLDSFG